MPSLPNILTGFVCDGSAGGDIVGGELVVDFTNTDFPLLTDGWPTADWPRNVYGVLLGGASFIRVLGIDGHGKSTGGRFFASPSQDGILLALWRVRKLVIETPNTGLLYIGFSTALALPYPYKINENGTGVSAGYLREVWKNGEDQTIVPNNSNAIVTTGPTAPPLVTDPNGLFIPNPEPDGVSTWEIVYVADNLRKYSSDTYDQMVANGDIIVYED